MVNLDDGPLRDAYLGTMTGVRGLLDGSSLLARWDRAAADAPRSTGAWLRTLLAVHNADDLVRMDLPWWTYDAIDRVERFLSRRGPDVRVFEYGSGASTVWLARRTAVVDTVEHDTDWAPITERLLASAAGTSATTTVHVTTADPSQAPLVGSSSPRAQGLDFTRYVATIDTLGDARIDLVVVDGRAREACLSTALGRVAPDGMVVLDDAQRDRYGPALAEARARGWLVEMTEGRTPCQPLPRATAVLRPRA